MPQDAVNQQGSKSQPVEEQQGIASPKDKEQESLADESSTTAVNGDEPLQPKSPDESMEIFFEREDNAEDEDTTSTKSQQTRPTVLTRNSKYS